MPISLFLEVFSGRNWIHSAPIGPEGLQIGRSATNALVLADLAVSKVHAQVHFEQQQLMLSDLKSTAGTFVRGVRIQSARIGPGDEFQIGPYTLRVSTTARPGDRPGQSTSPRPQVPPDLTPRLSATLASLGPLSSLAGITDCEQILKELLEQSASLIGAARGLVVMVHRGEFLPILYRQGVDLEEAFSRTVCRRVVENPVPLIVSGLAIQADEALRSTLARRQPAWVIALPLAGDGEVLGVLYLECDPPAPKDLESMTSTFEGVSHVGGQALRAAVDRQQLLADRERWCWLASRMSDHPDLFDAARSPAMREVAELVHRAAPEDISLLLRGESGTGKEIAASTVHRLSRRKDGPFIAVNCGALPDDLVEAELFGAEKGAFTGATELRLGRFELAQGGTLLLDEIGDLPRDLQVKLLRVMETRTIERLGGRRPIPWDGRLLAATHRDLEAAVRSGEFREDLYYRLNVMSIHLPPLRQRLEDIEPLVQQFLMAGNRRYTRKLLGVDKRALGAMLSYGWPGNIRELRNVIDRAFIIERGQFLTVSSLPFTVASTVVPRESKVERPVAEEELVSLAVYTEGVERVYIQKVLGKVGGNVTHAARILGMNRASLQRKLKHLGLRSTPSTDEE